MVKPASSITAEASTSSPAVVPGFTFARIASRAASATSCISRKAGVGSAPTKKVRSTCPV